VYGRRFPARARVSRVRAAATCDVIVFEYPKDPTLNYVKRVIGAPGSGGDASRQVYVNGVALDEPYVQRIDPLHDNFETKFSWQRAFLVRARLRSGAAIIRRATPGPTARAAASTSCWR